MNLLQVQNRIAQLMARWVAELKGSASMSHTDPNIASEYIALQLLREIYDWPDLRNLNTETASFPGIDLAGDTARVAIQVTTTPTLDKVKHTLCEFADEDRKLYERYDRLIIYILVEKQGSYSDRTFDDIIRGRFTFDKDRDILDYRDLLRAIQELPLDRAQRVLDILEEHFGGDLRAGTPPRATALVRPLPADLADFAGRQAQIDRVRAQLEQQGIVAITGMGGIGKTALAVHVVHQLIMEGLFPDAQLYIDLKGVDPKPVDPADALQSLLNAILEPDPNRPRDLHTLSALWRAAITGKDALLILDNAADATQVRPLLPGCPTCAVLVTSRRRFTLPGARRLDLRPMTPDEARVLLQKLAPHLDDDAAGRIADLCGYLPQALRIAGNYLSLNDDVTPEQYALMLSDERTRLAQLRDPDDPDLDVAAAIALSVAQLDDDTRRAWALLSLFSAPFDLPAAAVLWELWEQSSLETWGWEQPDEEQARNRIQILRNRSLVSYDHDSTRYHLHDLVRLVAAGELEALVEEKVGGAHLRLARYYEDMAARASLAYTEGRADLERNARVVRRINLEWPHIRAGQAWAAAHAEDNDEAARLCSDYPNSARFILGFLLDPQEFISWFEAAVRAARRLGDRKAEGEHLGHLGNGYAYLMELENAINCYQQALDIAREIDDTRVIPVWLDNLGLCYADLGEMRKAIDYYDQALESASASSEQEAGVVAHLARAYERLGETDEANFYRRRYLEIVEAWYSWNYSPVLLGIADTSAPMLPWRTWPEQRDLGMVFAGLGESEKAIECYTVSLGLARQIDDRQGEGDALYRLASIHADLGEIQQAREKYQQSLAILKALGSPNADTVRRLLAALDG